FTNAEHQIAAPIDHTVGVTQLLTRSYRLRNLPLRLPVELLILKVGKIDHAIINDVSSTTVLVHRCPGIESRRRDVVDIPVGRSAHDDAAAAFGRTALYPIDVVTVECDLVQPDRTRDDQVRGDRRLPRAKGACFWFDQG